jgi:hypothetical protein
MVADKGKEVQTDIIAFIKEANASPISDAWIEIGKVGVDSDKLMICDPAFIDPEWKNAICHSVENSDTDIVIDAKAPLFRIHPDRIAVAFSSGIGDGLYPVFVKFNGLGQVAEIKIVTLPFPRVEVKQKKKGMR